MLIIVVVIFNTKLQMFKIITSMHTMGIVNKRCLVFAQIVLENYAYPGLMLIGTDSHTPNGGKSKCQVNALGLL